MVEQDADKELARQMIMRELITGYQADMLTGMSNDMLCQHVHGLEKLLRENHLEAWDKAIERLTPDSLNYDDHRFINPGKKHITDNRKAIRLLRDNPAASHEALITATIAIDDLLYELKLLRENAAIPEKSAGELDLAISHLKEVEANVELLDVAISRRDCRFGQRDDQHPSLSNLRLMDQPEEISFTKSKITAKAPLKPRKPELDKDRRSVILKFPTPNTPER